MELAEHTAGIKFRVPGNDFYQVNQSVMKTLVRSFALVLVASFTALSGARISRVRNA